MNRAEWKKLLDKQLAKISDPVGVIRECVERMERAVRSNQALARAEQFLRSHPKRKLEGRK